MAYNPKQLSVLAYSGASKFTLWHYRTDDTLPDVLTPGYFDAASDMLRLGDVIMVGFSSHCVAQFSVLPCGDGSIMLIPVQ